MDQLHSSHLFQVHKRVHPITILSVFKGYPLPPENETGLLGLLDFILNTETPPNLLTQSLIESKCKIVRNYLKKNFSQLHDFASKLSINQARNLNLESNQEYTQQWLAHVESLFGTSLPILQMKSKDFFKKEEKRQEIDPIALIIEAHQRIQTYSIPKFQPPFYLLSNNRQTTEEKYSRKQEFTAKL